VDVYFIDYEKPNTSSRQVNAWRRIFVANEWQEMSSHYVYISPITVIFWFIWLWIGQGW